MRGSRCEVQNKIRRAVTDEQQDSIQQIENRFRFGWAYLIINKQIDGI
jgi:hypothetical protein